MDKWRNVSLISFLVILSLGVGFSLGISGKRQALQDVKDLQNELEYTKDVCKKLLRFGG